MTEIKNDDLLEILQYASDNAIHLLSASKCINYETVDPVIKLEIVMDIEYMQYYEIVDDDIMFTYLGKRIYELYKGSLKS